MLPIFGRSETVTRNTSVSIGKDQDKFIRAQVKKGRFGSASEAVRAGLRLLEEQELKIENLRKALIEGEDSGTPTPFVMADYIAAKRVKA
jgi:antitoxin ParD1/3/4